MTLVSLRTVYACEHTAKEDGSEMKKNRGGKVVDRMVRCKIRLNRRKGNIELYFTYDSFVHCYTAQGVKK